MAIPITVHANSPGILVFGRYNVRTAHIETIGTLFNQTQEVGSGSGLLLGDNFVLTNNHVVPREGDYRKLVVNVRLKSRTANPLPVTAIHRDETRDLALLELAQPVRGVDDNGRCPMQVILQADLAPIGSELYVLGFPVNQELAIANGILSNQSGAGGRWLTDTLINPGNSGGPAFDENAALVGIAVGGIVSFDTGGGNKVNVTGVNYIIPTAVIAASPLFEKLTQIPDGRRCWKEELIAVAESAAPEAGGRHGRARWHHRRPAPPQLPDTLNRSFTVSETKDDHPNATPQSGRYQKRFEAEPGYRITGCTPAPVSASHSHDVTCNLLDGGSAASFEFQLDSGPVSDRWRGWWTGTVTLSQQKRQ